MSRSANDQTLTDMANELRAVTLKPGAPATNERPRYCHPLPGGLWRVCRLLKSRGLVVFGVTFDRPVASYFADAMAVNICPWECEEWEEKPGVLNCPYDALRAVIDDNPAIRNLANRVTAHLELKGYLPDLELRRNARVMYRHIATDLDAIAARAVADARKAHKAVTKLYQV